jgi:hypothetical protein
MGCLNWRGEGWVWAAGVCWVREAVELDYGAAVVEGVVEVGLVETRLRGIESRGGLVSHAAKKEHRQLVLVDPEDDADCRCRGAQAPDPRTISQDPV